MTNVIMVPLDGSGLSEQAVTYAIGIAEMTRAVLHLVFVSDTRGEDPGASDPMKYLTDLRQRISARYGSVRLFSLTGAVVPTLARHIRRHNVDLAIMTTHGRGGLSRSWLGNAAERLVRSTAIPTLLLRPRTSQAEATGPCPPIHILVPLDGSELAESILEPALSIGAIMGARFSLVQVVEVERLRTQALVYLNGVRDRLRHRGINVDTNVIVQTQSAAGIVEESIAANCDLIAIATHGMSGGSRLSLGSVADKVIRSAIAPVLTFRPSAAIAWQLAGSP